MTTADNGVLHMTYS